jgi:glycosyltransferase involved in cell wall biosynthesis
MNLWLLTHNTTDPWLAAFANQVPCTIITPDMPGFASRRTLPLANATQQISDPSFPYNLMAPELAISYEMADQVERLAQTQGAPDALICLLDGALPYFLLQRRLTNLSLLANLPLVVLAQSPQFLQQRDRQSAYRFPRYWVRRMEQFCLRGADLVLAESNETLVALQNAVQGLSSPCITMAALPQILPDLIRNYQPRSSFPSNTPQAQGSSLPRAADEQPGLLSVVVPFYNLGQYIGEALASLVASSYRPLEIIVVDDGSRAEERRILEREAANYGGLVRILSQANGGLARARNAGAAAAHGEFLAFCDADDTVLPGYFSKAISVFQRHHNISFVSAWVQLFGVVNTCVPNWNPEFPFLLGRNMMLEQVVLRRADFLQYGQNDPAIAYAFEDHETWIRMHAAGCVGVNIPEVLAHYRIRSDSMLRSAQRETQQYLIELIMQKHQSLYQQYGAELFALQHANGAALDWNQPAMPTTDYRLQAEQAEAAYQQLRKKLTILDPLVQFVRRFQHKS